MRGLRTVVTLGILSAMSVALAILIRFPIFPAVPDLIYEPADVPILIVGFAFGPVAGLMVTAVVAILMALVTSLGGPFGALMHFLATGALVGTSSLIYERLHTKSGAALALVAGTLAMTAVMIPANVILTPIFYGMYGWTTAKVISVIWWIIAFNLVKAGLNSAITFLVYKRVANFVRNACLARRAKGETRAASSRA
ncbi:MAG TPA: ECF transporter S component [Firmicutes bacterium]|nr:ECF transporter S component [Bacillota bacterium]